MTNETMLRNVIKEMIKQELEENSTSGATPGFMSPNAFQGNSDMGKKKHHSNVEVASDYTLIEPEVKADSVKEARSKYLDYKHNSSGTPIQKIGRTLAEMSRSLTEIEDAVSMVARLKTETNTPNSQLWKRSLKHILKIEGRVIKLAHRLRELKQ